MNFICMYIENQLARCKPMVVAIDGRCGSGKTTLAEFLADRFGGRVVHMDDFFLPPEKRTPERLAQAGENVEYERILTEVAPFLHNSKMEYRAYDCTKNDYVSVLLPNQPLTIIEGSYSMHPALRHLYDFKIFCDIDPKEQEKRIKAREGDRSQVFFDKWIPLEEKYFAELDIQNVCDVTYESGVSYATSYLRKRRLRQKPKDL
ncbi:MAG: hypothetical protein IKB44_03385 [Clostridia bacterium]|nr:hypothetical protein [Clostridia bacterium]